MLGSAALSAKLTTTTTPDGAAIRLQPMAVDVPGGVREMVFAPGYGEHSEAVLAECGYAPAELDRLRQDGIIL